MDQLLGKTSLDPTWHFVRADSTLIPLEEYPVHRILQTQTAFQDYVLGIYQGGYLRSWVLVNGFPEFDAHHQLSQVVITFVDISGLKQAEASLFQSLRGVGVGWSHLRRLRCIDAEGVSIPERGWGGLELAL